MLKDKMNNQIIIRTNKEEILQQLQLDKHKLEQDQEVILMKSCLFRQSLLNNYQGMTMIRSLIFNKIQNKILKFCCPNCILQEVIKLKFHSLKKEMQTCDL